MVRDADHIEVGLLQWNDENREHIARHGLEPEDVESVRTGEPLFFHNLPDRIASHIMIGYDAKGRALYVALRRIEGTIWMVVTAWQSRRAQRILEADK